MKTKRTNKELLVKGLKLLGLSAATMFLGPTLYYIALTNQNKPLFIPILAIAIITCGLAIYLVFKGIKTILDSLFTK